MNLQNIFNEIEKKDPEIYERLDNRRNIMRRFKNFGGRLSLAAVPVALGGMLNKAYGQTPATIVDILNFVLKLEYLESEYYTIATGTPGLIDPSETTSFNIMKQQEDGHVAFITSAITSLGGTPDLTPEFDFTAGGTYKVFEKYESFLGVSQLFEDTCVRAYKGQVNGLLSNNEVLTAALQIHSVEARHAAHVRKIRRTISGSNTEKPWISGNSTNLKQAQATYDGEENTIQVGIDVETFRNTNTRIATESFDEPLTMDEVEAIIKPFIIP